MLWRNLSKWSFYKTLTTKETSQVEHWKDSSVWFLFPHPVPNISRGGQNRLNNTSNSDRCCIIDKYRISNERLIFFPYSKIPSFFTGWQAEKRASDRHRNFRIPHGVLMLEGAYYPSDVTDTITTKKNSLHLIWSHKKFLSDTQIARFSASSSLCLEIKMTTLMTNKPRGHELPRLKMWLKLPSDSQILEIPFENSKP